MDVENDAQAALVEVLEEADVAAIDDPGVRAKKSGKNTSPIDTDFCFTFQTFVVPHLFVPKELLSYCLFPCQFWHLKRWCNPDR